ncbi:MAG: PRD domain-containing protein, partial [Trichococcus sp.]|nr:PRD domain-containing protein [Trichococcus sp.]
VAKWMKQELQKEYNINIPEVETYYLTLLLVLAKARQCYRPRGRCDCSPWQEHSNEHG